MRKYNVAVVGATGAVGNEMIRILEERDFPVAELKLLASERSRGKELTYKGKEYPVYVLDEKLNRITLTHPVLCAASHVAVLVSGEEKAGILKKVLTSEPDDIRYPIHLLWSVLDKVTWLVDRNAAKAI